MADDWQPGDLALCVRSSSSVNNPTRSGVIYTVGLVWVHPGTHQLVLDFAGIENGDPFWIAGFWGHCATRFRKIRPHTPDAEDAETIRLLTGNPAKVPA